ncbi:MAG: hypothetical protein IJ604_10830 [Prevotella sp.]|nr:hypothetical protein [Prevotella sp.]
MKQNQLIVKTIMVAALFVGGVNTANAQFGKLKGLADKAKKAVQDKAKQTVDGAKNNATTTATQKSSANESQTQAGQPDQGTQDYIKKLQTQYDDANSGDFDQKSDGSYWIWLSSGYGTRVTAQEQQLLGKWYPKEKKLWFSSESFTIADDGKVYDSKGEWRAIIQDKRIVTCAAEELLLDVHDKWIDVRVGQKVIGQVTSDGRVMLGGDAYAAAASIDMRALAFCCFGVQYTKEELLALCAKREKAVTDQQQFEQDNAELAEFTGRVTRMAVRENVEKNGMKGDMDSRDWYIYEETNNLNRGCHWVTMDGIRVVGWNPENNKLLDRDYNWLGTFSGGVLYDRWGVKYGSVQNNVIKNRHGQVVGKLVHGDFTGTYLASKGKFYNWKLTDASGKQVGLLATNASPNLAAVWAFCMFAKK